MWAHRLSLTWERTRMAAGVVGSRRAKSFTQDMFYAHLLNPCLVLENIQKYFGDVLER